MTTIHYYVRRNSNNTYAGEGTESRDGLTLAMIQSRMPAGFTALDADTGARPPDPPIVPDPRITQAKAKWAAAPAAVKNDAMIALALMLGIEDPV